MAAGGALVSARDELRKYVHLLADAWTPRQTTDDRVEWLYGLVRDEAFLEAADEIDVADDCGCGGCDSCATQAAAARLREKAREKSSREADATPDFYQSGRTYRHSAWSFRCDALTTDPDTGERVALGWFRFREQRWRPFTAGTGHWRDGWRDITTLAPDSETPAHATTDTPGERT
ncbi:hypothetical protein [Streptomyces sp. NPDC044948]|uniref:hypothetical protein n=1 Tax=Streptomyces sp. NPDC044948 TaxID=3157092 RepID=UPI0033C5F65D